MTGYRTSVSVSCWDRLGLARYEWSKTYKTTMADIDEDTGVQTGASGKVTPCEDTIFLLSLLTFNHFLEARQSSGWELLAKSETLLRGLRQCDGQRGRSMYESPAISPAIA